MDATHLLEVVGGELRGPAGEAHRRAVLTLLGLLVERVGEGVAGVGHRQHGARDGRAEVGGDTSRRLELSERKGIHIAVETYPEQSLALKAFMTTSPLLRQSIIIAWYPSV